DLQLDIDQVTQRLGEHTAQLNVHQAKFQFDSQQADSARAAELATEQRIAAIEDEMNAKNCNSPAASSVSSNNNNTTNTTNNNNTTANSASVKGNAAGPLVLNSAGVKSTSSTTTTAVKSSNNKKNNNNNSSNQRACDNLAAQENQVQNDLA